jgi:superoxide dismutase
MLFTLPELPYSYDALAPYMSRETLEYHHDKHHLLTSTTPTTSSRAQSMKASHSKTS